MDNSFLHGVFGIASALIGVALVTLLIGQSSKTTAVVKQAGDSFNQLLQTVTMQGNGSIGGF